MALSAKEDTGDVKLCIGVGTNFLVASQISSGNFEGKIIWKDGVDVQLYCDVTKSQFIT